MIKKTQEWLSNPTRDYARGLAIFNQFSGNDFKSKYGEFLKMKEENEEVKPFDPRFPMLINKVTAIFQKMKLNPEAFQDQRVKEEGVTETLRSIILGKSRTIKKLTEEKQSLTSEIESLKDSEEIKQDEINELQEELEEKDEELQQLQDDLEQGLKTSGLKIVQFADMPSIIKGKYNRTKEITPLVAKIHAELTASGLTDADRKIKAEELCTLDDERRALWDEIDGWSEGKDCIVGEQKEEKYSEDPLVKGMQIANRIKRLKENVFRTKEAHAKHLESGKQNMIQKSRERLIAYENELKELIVLVENE